MPSKFRLAGPGLRLQHHRVQKGERKRRDSHPGLGIFRLSLETLCSLLGLIFWPAAAAAAVLPSMLARRLLSRPAAAQPFWS